MAGKQRFEDPAAHGRQPLRTLRANRLGMRQCLGRAAGVVMIRRVEHRPGHARHSMELSACIPSHSISPENCCFLHHLSHYFAMQ
jgi:hypothetical protein